MESKLRFYHSLMPQFTLKQIKNFLRCSKAIKTVHQASADYESVNEVFINLDVQDAQTKLKKIGLEMEREYQELQKYAEDSHG